MKRASPPHRGTHPSAAYHGKKERHSPTSLVTDHPTRSRNGASPDDPGQHASGTCSTGHSGTSPDRLQSCPTPSGGGRRGHDTLTRPRHCVCPSHQPPRRYPVGPQRRRHQLLPVDRHRPQPVQSHPGPPSPPHRSPLRELGLILVLRQYAADHSTSYPTQPDPQRHSPPPRRDPQSSSNS